MVSDPLQPDLDATQLRRLYALARALLTLDDYDQLLDAVVGHALEVLGAERGFLVLRRNGGDLDLKVVRNWHRAELEGDGEPISRSIVAAVLEGGRPMLVEDALADRRWARSASVLQQGIRSVLAAPIVVRDQPLGALYLESRSIKSLFGAAELSLFEHLLELSSRALGRCLERIALEERSRLAERLLPPRDGFHGILTRDPGFLHVLDMARQVARAELPVLVQGPTGTGKELVVSALHLESGRAEKPLVTINCGAISPQLLESELFGHLRGAFTGANRDKTGLITTADGGTVFLDEVGELPLELQVKLLRTLQFGEVQPVGATRPAHVDVRFLAATNRDLETEVANGTFREDLLFRLNVVTLDLPPLRERPDDVLPLFNLFLQRAFEEAARPLPPVSPRLERVLQAYDWPGNVRELENEARRLVAVTPAGTPLTADRLSTRLGRPRTDEHATAHSLADHERELIELHLRQTGGNKTQAARSLGISREGLRKKMKRLGLG